MLLALDETTNARLGVCMSILHLLPLISPSAIARLVVAVVVDSIDGEAFRSLSHIGEEVFEGAPALTNGNSSATVIRPTRIVGIVAALEDSSPSVVGRRMAKAVLVIGGLFANAVRDLRFLLIGPANPAATLADVLNLDSMSAFEARMLVITGVHNVQILPH